MLAELGNRLTKRETHKITKLIETLEQGGQRLQDDAVGLKKPYPNGV